MYNYEREFIITLKILKIRDDIQKVITSNPMTQNNHIWVFFFVFFYYTFIQQIIIDYSINSFFFLFLWSPIFHICWNFLVWQLKNTFYLLSFFSSHFFLLFLCDSFYCCEAYKSSPHSQVNKDSHISRHSVDIYSLVNFCVFYSLVFNV